VVAAAMSLVCIATGYGGPEVLSVTDQPTPEPGPGEARIEVRAIGVNPVDHKAYSGMFGTDPARLPLRLGFEAAGVVTAVGPDAIGPAGPVAVGDEVIAYRAPGAYAAELVVPAQALVPKPASLDWAQAAGLLLTGATAWHALVATGVHAGDTVLIHGAAGGVGLVAVQLAAARGATVHYLLGSRRQLGTDPLSAAHLRALVPGLHRQEAYICGPPGMTGAAVSALRTAGVPRRRIHYRVLRLLNRR